MRRRPSTPRPWRAVLGAAVAVAVSAAAPDAARAAALDVVVRSALADFPAIRAAQANRSVGEFRIDEARARHLPVFDIGAAGRVGGSAVTTPLPRARVNLWAGGAIDAAVERESQRATSLERREAVTRDDVAFAAAQAYLRMLRAWWLVGVSEANLGRHRQLVANFEEIVRVDAGRRFDLVQAQARMQGVRGTLEDRLAELGSARQALARYYPPPLEPTALGLPAIDAMPPADRAALSIDDHPSVAAARSDVLAAEANARTLRLQRGPRLDLEAVGGRDPASQVVLSWPAFDATLSAAEQGAVAAQMGAEATLQDVSLAIQELRRQAEQDFLSAGRRIEQARRQTELATELVTIYFEQFRVGRRNLLDLLSAYAELSNGETNLAGSQVDQVLARYRIAYTTGRFAPLFDGALAALPTAPAPDPARVPPYADATGAAPAERPAAVPTGTTPARPAGTMPATPATPAGTAPATPAGMAPATPPGTRPATPPGSATGAAPTTRVAPTSAPRPAPSLAPASAPLPSPAPPSAPALGGRGPSR
jgi:adhesin transport system outer membrane protein